MTYLPLGITQQAAAGAGGGGGGGSWPMMDYGGGTAYYNTNPVYPAGEALTVVLGFQTSSWADASWRVLYQYGSYSTWALFIVMAASDHADPTFRNRIWAHCYNGGYRYSRVSTGTYADDAQHVLFCSFDLTAGTDMFYIDGVSVPDTGHTYHIDPTPAMTPGAGYHRLGRHSHFGQQWVGKLGYHGQDWSYLTNPTDFYHPVDGLQTIDEIGWTEWGGQPEYWNQYGTMEDNKGTGANLPNVGVTGPT